MLASAQSTLWPHGNARTVPRGQQDFGIIHPLQMGLSNTLEVSLQPLLTLSLSPNISVKNRWVSNTWMVASQHTYVMPTMLMRAVKDLKFRIPGTDTLLIPDSVQIPYIYYIRNEVLVNRVIARETILTGRAGFDMAFKNKKDSLPVPDHPLLYIPSYNLSKRLSWFAGVRLDGNMVKNFNYMADVRFVSSGLGIKDWELIHRGYFIWNKSIRFAALIGYRLSYGH